MAAKKKKSEEKGQKIEETRTEIEKKRQKHPVMYILSFLLLLIVIVTFVGVPVVSKMGGPNPSVIGSYRGEKIKFTPGNYFSQQVQRINDYYNRMNEDQSSQNTIQQRYRVWRQAFESTVLHKAMLYRAKESGVTVSEDKIDKTLTKRGPYVENGEFSQERYENTAASERYSNRTFYRKQLIHELYSGDMLNNQLYSEDELNSFIAMASPERKFSFIAFNIDDYPQSNTAKYGRENSELFERVKYSKITLDIAEGEAGKLYDRITARETTFEDVAKNHSTDRAAEKGGDMGWAYVYELQQRLPKEASEMLSQAEAGDISAPIKSDYGWLILKCNEKDENPDFENEETIDAVKRYLMQNQRGKVEGYFEQRASAFRAEALNSSFTEAGDEFEKDVKETDFFPINYGNLSFLTNVAKVSDHPAFSRAGYRKSFFNDLFSLKKDDVSEPIILDKYVMVFQLIDEREAEEGPTKDQFKLTYEYRMLPQYANNDFRHIVMNSEALKDNFSQFFSKVNQRSGR